MEKNGKIFSKAFRNYFEILTEQKKKLACVLRPADGSSPTP
jgi:hypothetical protein